MSVEPATAALERAVRTAQVELADLVAARRRATDLLAAAWVGGNRARFDDRAVLLDRRTRARVDDLAELARLLARAGDEPAGRGA